MNSFVFVVTTSGKRFWKRAQRVVNCKRHLPSIKNPDLLIKVIGLLLLIDAINYPALMKKHETSRSEVTFSLFNANAARVRMTCLTEARNPESTENARGRKEKLSNFSTVSRPTHCPTSLSPFFLLLSPTLRMSRTECFRNGFSTFRECYVKRFPLW